MTVACRRRQQQNQGSITMNPAAFLLEAQAQQIVRAEVLEIQEDGTFRCAYDDEEPGVVSCDLLSSSEGPPPRLTRGDPVLVWLPGREDDRGVILGRLGPGRAPAPARAETPDELIIEAKNELTLKCGEGSITLRGD